MVKRSSPAGLADWFPPEFLPVTQDRTRVKVPTLAGPLFFPPLDPSVFLSRQGFRNPLAEPLVKFGHFQPRHQIPGTGGKSRVGGDSSQGFDQS